MNCFASKPREEKRKLLLRMRDGVLNTLNEQFYPYQRDLSDLIISNIINKSGQHHAFLQPPQTGKSYTISRTVVPLIWAWPTFFSTPLRIGVFAPAHAQAQIIYSECLRLINLMDNAGFDFKMERRTQNDFILTNGSKIFTKSCELTAEQKGPTIDVGFVDEAPDVPESTLREAVFFRGAATSAPYFLLGSPSMRMKNDYFFDMVQKGKAHVTSAAQARAVNPMFDQFCKDAIARYGEDDEYIQMQIFLNWIVGKNQFITPDQLAACRCKDAPLSSAANIPIYIGLDWGKSNDSTAVAIGTRVGLKVKLLALLELLGEFQPDQTEAITRFINAFGRPKSIYADSTATQYQATDYIKKEFPSATHYYPYSQQSKHDLFYNFHRLLRPASGGQPLFEYPSPHQPDKLEGETRSLALKDNKVLARFEDQMLGLEKEIVQGGIWRVAAQERKGAHDDLPNAAALMCLAAMEAKSVAVLGFNDFAREHGDSRDNQVRDFLQGR